MSDVTRTNRDLNALHPKVKELAVKLLEEAERQGLKIGISETYRSPERQDYLYAQGRTRPGRIVTYVKGSSMSSYHQWRLAFDVYHNVRGDEYNHTVLDKVGRIGESIGLEWGGGWSGFKDSPHFQYTFGLSIADLKNGKRPPEYAPETDAEKAQKRYKEAIEYLQESRLLNTFEAWYPEPSAKYFETLLNNLMPSVIAAMSYEYQVLLLEKIGVISSTQIWLNRDFRVPYMKIVIARLATKIKQQSNVQEPIEDEGIKPNNGELSYEEAVDYLVARKIITSPEAWQDEPQAKYFEILLEKMLVVYIKGVSFDEIIEILHMVGVISSTEIWLNRDFRSQYMKIVIERLTDIIRD